MAKINICTVVAGKTLPEFLQNLTVVQAMVEMIELRVDYIKDLCVTDIQAIRAKTTKPAIFTCRRQEEGGKFTDSERKRREIIQQAARLGFAYVDIELAVIDQFDLASLATKIICSYHDFTKTSSYAELEKIADQMRRKKAEVIKIVTMVEGDADVKNLYRLLVNKKEREKMIVLGMGEEGKATRVIAPLLGGFLTYASMGEKTAPGQISFDELKKIYRYLDRDLRK